MHGGIVGLLLLWMTVLVQVCVLMGLVIVELTLRRQWLRLWLTPILMMLVLVLAMATVVALVPVQGLCNCEGFLFDAAVSVH